MVVESLIKILPVPPVADIAKNPLLYWYSPPKCILFITIIDLTPIGWFITCVSLLPNLTFSTFIAVVEIAVELPQYIAQLPEEVAPVNNKLDIPELSAPIIIWLSGLLACIIVSSAPAPTIVTYGTKVIVSST